MIDNDVDRRIRNLQVKLIKTSEKTVSYSVAVNQLLRNVLKK